MSVNVPMPHPGWMKPLARLGYASRGLVFLVIAVFALLAAIGGGETQDSRGALRTLVNAPAGDVFAALLVVGLAGHSAWRLVQSLGDTDDHGVSAKGLAIRTGLFVAGIIYAILTVYVISLWRGFGSDDGGGGAFAQYLSGFVGARPAAWLLAAVFLGVAAAHAVKAVRKGYRKYILAPPRLDRHVDVIAQTGLFARGAVFAIIAVLFATRGITGGGEGGETPGIGDALDYITGLPFGRVLLALAGVGLCAFALYSFIEALWRKVNVENASVKP